MSLNTAHLNNGVLIHSGECILIFCDNVSMEWSGQENPAFNGTKNGRIYLTTHRMIFNTKNSKDAMQSFSFPFVTLSDVELEQPIFGANYIKGKVRAQPNGNWIGEAKFKMHFKHGGAIDFGQAMLKAARLATHQTNMQDPPPPYVPPSDNWYDAPPPAYAPPPQGYYGWMPPTNTFPDRPPANTVFMTDGPPPYPGIGTGAQPQPAPYGQQPGGYGMPPQSGGYGPPPQSGGYGPPPQSGGYGPPPQSGGYGPPPPSGGYGPPPQSAGYGFQQPVNYGPPQLGGYGGPQPQYPNAPPPGYGNQGAFGTGQPGFNPGDAKAAEAAQSAYYDPNRPQMAYVPPPAYYENPPSYHNATSKKDQ